MTTVTFGELNTTQRTNLAEFITRLDVSFTMDMASQLTIEVIDQDLRLTKGNYFQIRRTVTYGTNVFEIASVAISSAGANSARVTLECRSKPIQQLKRDKNPESFNQTSATEFARVAASRYGMKFYGQPSGEKVTINKSTDPDSAESAYTVLKSAASASQFVCFEADNTLYFASQEYLMGKWGNFTVPWPTSDAQALQLIDIPNFRSSDDDPMAATFQAQFVRKNATQLRPGQTITFSGVTGFETRYIITEVSYDDFKETPVSVSGRTPEKIKPKPGAKPKAKTPPQTKKAR
jgi:hypothetical protein